MADGGGGPRGSTGDDRPRAGSDGYDWLYAAGGSSSGASTRRTSGDDEPTQQWGAGRGSEPGAEATQVIPAFDRFGGPPPVRIAPTPGGPGSPPGGPRRPPGAPAG